MDNLSFSEQIAQSKSIQGIIRALILFNKTKRVEGVKSIIQIESSEIDGALVNFGSSNNIDNVHESFAVLLSKCDRLTYLEHTIELLRDLNVDNDIIKILAKEALELAKDLYPEINIESSFSDLEVDVNGQ